ncbi:hypothetical protein L207DRAFT_483 [Hyaloscypha variabilis F]|uniref:Uncharacterized protein n=1 Tax=Hyaloscypha variabilis (strain UAMH 11265 / GT02V1 / F) TaxID=1149755 RepID=A0A2J6SBA3_HYAVF|nr:hypothetical protein L207DRAFT_483 [Hyaloscypha variabilis F]
MGREFVVASRGCKAASAVWLSSVAQHLGFSKPQTSDIRIPILQSRRQAHDIKNFQGSNILHFVHSFNIILCSITHSAHRDLDATKILTSNP